MHTARPPRRGHVDEEWESSLREIIACFRLFQVPINADVLVAYAEYSPRLELQD